MLRPDGKTRNFLAACPDPLQCPSTIVPFADCPSPLLWLTSLDDQAMNTPYYADLAERLLREAGKTNFEIFRAPHAGHLCELPYTPPLTVTRHPAISREYYAEYGGAENPAGHVRGQQDMWVRTLDFFKEKLMHSS